MLSIGTKRPDEVSCYGFASEVIADIFTKSGATLEIETTMLKAMMDWPGHIGVTPAYPNMVHIYDTREHAEEAYTRVKELGFKVGGGVTEVLVKKQYLPKQIKEGAEE